MHHVANPGQVTELHWTHFLYCFQNKSRQEFLAQSCHVMIQHCFRFKMERLQNALHNDWHYLESMTIGEGTRGANQTAAPCILIGAWAPVLLLKAPTVTHTCAPIFFL